MTRDEIIRMAREAGGNELMRIDGAQDSVVALMGNEIIERFAALVVAVEREACAQLEYEAGIYTKHDLAAAIRARGRNEMPGM